MRYLHSALLFATNALAASVAVTEVANITLVANASTSVFDRAAKTILHHGAVTVRSSRLVENSDSFRLFVDWPSIDASRKFAKSSAYHQIQQQIKPVVKAPPVLYHIAFSPAPPVVFDNYEGKGESPFSEFLNFFFPGGEGKYSEERKTNVTETVQALLEKNAPTAEGFTGHTAVGWGLDEIEYMGASCRVFAIGVGWKTVEAHQKWMTTPAYAAFLPQLRGLDGLIGIEMRHVSNKILKA